MTTLTTRRPPLFRLAAGLLAGALLAAVACATNPATGRRQLVLFTEQEEIQMGREADQEIVASLGLYPDEGVQRYVQELGSRLAQVSERPHLPWSFRVVDDPIVNAFALPGGFIYVTRGIMTHLNSEAELTGVLGHEIGHVTGRHSVNRLSKAQLVSLGLGVGMILEPQLGAYGDLAQIGFGLLFLKYSRDDERQADDLGLRYLLRAGYAPRPMTQVFAVLKRVGEGEGGGRLPNWLSTHPDPENRARRLEEQITVMAANYQATTVGRETYLARLDGMVFGDNPREGFFKESRFYHPDLQFQMEFPEGWKTSNQKQAVSALSPKEDAVVVLSLSDKETPDEAAREFFGQSGVTRIRSWRREIGGLPAHSGSFTAASRQGAIRGLAAFVAYQGRVYQLLGFSREDRWRGHESAIEASLGSFRRLTDERYLAVQPRRLEIVQLPRAMTLQEFASRYPSTVPIETLALINHVELDSQLPTGAEVKRVVGGVIP